MGRREPKQALARVDCKKTWRIGKKMWRRGIAHPKEKLLLWKSRFGNNTVSKSARKRGGHSVRRCLGVPAQASKWSVRIMQHQALQELSNERHVFLPILGQVWGHII